MLGPLMILALLSVCGGWIGIDASALSSRPQRRARSRSRQVPVQLEHLFSVVAVLVAARRLVHRRQVLPAQAERPAQLAAALPGAYKLLVQQVLRRRVLRRSHRQAAARLLQIRARAGWLTSRILGGAGLAARRHRHLCRSDPAALAIGQSALLRGVAGRRRGGCAALRCWFRGPRCWPRPAIHLELAGH